MKKLSQVLSIAAAIAVAVIGASAQAEEGSQVAEIGCAKCAYSMEGVESCAAAVKVDGVAHMLKSEPAFDLHAAGLCKTTSHAHLTGKVQDGAFHASSVEVVDIHQVAEIACGTCIYGMEGTGCPPAVKIGEETYWMKGLKDFNAHGEGLCDAAKPAHLSGNIEKGKFMAKAVTILEKVDQVAEVGCASCSYSMEGVKGCKTAVMLDGTAYLVDGLSDFDAHSAGLCKSTKQGHIVGMVQDGKFVAESLELQTN